MKGNALFHILKYNMRINRPNSQTTEAERVVIKKFASGVKYAVEIGVYEGVNTVLIAKYLSEEGILYAIDPFFKGRLGISYHEIIARNEIKKNGLKTRVKLLQMFSYEATTQVPNDLDFIFIDGDHTYQGIKKDWNDWRKKVKIGGIIALHDTSIPSYDKTVENLGSYKFFNEVIRIDKGFQVEETIDSLNILRKIIS